ncbi:MAG: DEAD/DEAH box helicase [Solirubrobacteraceae bacterium]
MFGRGVQELLTALPRLDGLDADTVRRLLSGAWLEVAERRELDAPQPGRAPVAGELRRLAIALQIHAVIVPELDQETVRACAFVAAEALDIARELAAVETTDDEPIDYERVVVGLLYLIAGYDANASVAVRTVQLEGDVPDAERYALQSVLALLTGGRVPEPPDAAEEDGYLHERVRSALLRRIGELVGNFTQWLRDPTRPAASEPQALLELADELRLSEQDLAVAGHADVQHLARLSSTALAQAAGRALRNVPAPDGAPETFTRFLASTCGRQPLLWPAAAEYAATVLSGPPLSAVVAVPTGAGKSGVADLAIQHAITHGWALYLAPTNALVGQIRRQLRREHPGVLIREFLGGAEYTTLAGEELQDITIGQVLVMTPEKCSLALRQSPESFADLALLVLDEAHVLGEQRGRGALCELVVSEVLARAEHVSLLLMSALIANPDALAEWLAQAHSREVIVIREPWRPTRTLRAVVGIDRPATLTAAQEPAEELAALPVRRRNVGFDAPLAVLAGLRGPWSTVEPNDYSLVSIGAITPMKVTRPAGGGEIFADADSVSVRATVEALAQLLGDRGQKVMAFLPRSKHDSFLAALSLPGFGEVEIGGAVRALLGLAEAELGVESLLGTALAKGVGVHTSALLVEERRASELSFDEGEAAVLFATGTLAQGLNLPATSVIVGGTDIGYDPDQSAAEKLNEQRSQLLNAIGRAGRARVAVRSLALVVPNRPPLLDADTVVDRVLPRAEFLAEEDASTQLSSALRPLLTRIQDGTVDAEQLWPSDHVAISYLVPTDGETPAAAILGRTWAAYQAAVTDQAEALATSMAQLGQHALEANGGPTWAAEAARRAGVPLPIAGRFATFLPTAMAATSSPDSVQGWLELMVNAIGAIPAGEVGLLLQRSAFRSTALNDLWSEDQAERQWALAAMQATLEVWLDGETLAVVGGAAHSTGVIQSAGRGQRDPLPRTIRVVENGIGFGLTRAAGLLAATLDVAVDREVLDTPAASSRDALERLPIALRLGAGDQIPLALLRAGARPRLLAHLLARRLDPPEQGLNDDALRDWARGKLAKLEEDVDEVAADTQERQLIAQFLLARQAR